MNILLTNDDGYQAEGILALAQALQEIGSHNVVIFAPQSNRSACSHSLTVRRPIKVLQGNDVYGAKVYYTDGTPADCVKYACLYMQACPDLIMSGINIGSNAGTDVVYSGTVAAAFEGRIMGYKAAAFSINSFNPDKELLMSAARYFCSKIDEIIKYELRPNAILNYNYPNCKEIKGEVFTPLGLQLYDDMYTTHETDAELFLLQGRPITHEKNIEDCDIEWINKGYVTCTPLSYDVTDYELLNKLKKAAKGE